MAPEPYDRFWAAYFGIAPSDWNLPGISINGHAGLEGYQGAWFFRRLDRIVVTAPPGWLEYLHRHLAEVATDNLMEESVFRELFGDACDRIIGPVFQGFLLPDRFKPVHTVETIPVTQDHAQAVEAFRKECGDEDWEYSGLSEATEYFMAAFDGPRIVSMAAYRSWEENVGDPCVLTHSEYRGRGYAAAVTSAVVERALKDRKIPLYQTLETNTGAVKIARKLGYEQYARQFAVRLKAEAPNV